jgi:hypothetical protein
MLFSLLGTSLVFEIDLKNIADYVDSQDFDFLNLKKEKGIEYLLKYHHKEFAEDKKYDYLHNFKTMPGELIQFRAEAVTVLKAHITKSKAIK